MAEYHTADRATSLHLDGQKFLQQGRAEDAVRVLHAAAAESPTAEICNDLGVACLFSHQYDTAQKVFRKTIASWPHAQKPRRNFARLLTALGKDQEAAELLLDIPESTREPETRRQLTDILNDAGLQDSAAHWIALGEIQQTTGQGAAAAESYRKALELRPEDTGLCRRLVEMTPEKTDAAQIARMEAGLTRPALPDGAQADLHFALARALDAQGNYQAAFPHLEAGNACKRRTVQYHEAGAIRAMEAMQTAFPVGYSFPAAPQNIPGPKPLFIVGMPRSGTTLVEQILASHTDIFGGGEREDFPNLVLAHCPKDPATWPDLPAETQEALRRDYRDQIRPLAPDAAWITDKLPANAVFAGLICQILPEARIIWVERDAMDCCFSCYMQIFTGDLPYMYDQGELGRYARAQTQLMRHWENVLPKTRFLHIRYEDLLAEPETNMRRLIAFCGLGWQEQCLHFENTDRPVHTASALQVRRPLNRHTGGRWKPYAEGLSRLQAALNGEGNQAQT